MQNETTLRRSRKALTELGISSTAHSTAQGRQNPLLVYDRAPQPFLENGQTYLTDRSVWGGADIFGKRSGILKDRTSKQRAKI